jgi:hypothetical protein
MFFCSTCKFKFIYTCNSSFFFATHAGSAVVKKSFSPRRTVENGERDFRPVTKMCGANLVRGEKQIHEAKRSISRLGSWKLSPRGENAFNKQLFSFFRLFLIIQTRIEITNKHAEYCCHSILIYVLNNKKWISNLYHNKLMECFPFSH